MNQPNKWWSNPGCSFNQINICGFLDGSLFKNMSDECDQCGVRFNIIRRKKQCQSCSLFFCSNCLKIPPPTKMCRKCQILSIWPIERSQINSLRVRDLQHYLRAYKITTNTCTEKKDLVDLVIAQVTTIRLKSHRSAHNPSTSGDGIRVAPMASTAPILNEEDEGIRVFAVSPDHMHHSSSSSSASSWSMLHTDEEISPTNATSPITEPPPVVEVMSEPVPESIEVESLEAPEQIHNEEAVVEQMEGVENIPVGASEEPPQEEAVPEPQPTTSKALSNIIKLNSLATEDDVKALSVRQCKELLTLHRVDFSGIREKPELVSKVIILWKDYMERSVDISTLPEDQICKICMDAAMDCVFLQCGHVVACTFCGKQCAECPICRQNVVRVVRIFKA